MEKKSLLFLFIVVLAVIIIAVYISRDKNSDVDEETAKCIASKSIVYISTGCIACKNQEEMFGDNFKLLNIIDCAITSDKCENITRVPTWIINNQQYAGVQSIDELKQLTGC